VEQVEEAGEMAFLVQLSVVRRAQVVVGLALKQAVQA